MPESTDRPDVDVVPLTGAWGLLQRAGLDLPDAIMACQLLLVAAAFISHWVNP